MQGGDMRRVLILCLFLLLSKTTGECATNLFPPLQPMGGDNSNNNAIQDYSDNLSNLPEPQQQLQQQKPSVSNSNSNISQIEQSIFGRSFENQNISTRLSRIEKSLFSTTYPTSPDAQRIDNIISNYNQINKYPNISKKDLSKLESRVLSQNFPQNSAQRRIERLEQQMLGAVQSGDLDARFQTLKIVSKNYNTNQSDYSPDPFQSAGSGWKGLRGGWGNMLNNNLMGGSMTGFTPPISPFSTNNLNAYNNSSTYNNGYNNFNRYNRYTSGYSPYRGNRTNTSYHEGYDDFSTNTGAGVTILD